MNYSIPQEYRVQSREDYMADFFHAMDIADFNDGIIEGEHIASTGDFKESSAEYAVSTIKMDAGAYATGFFIGIYNIKG